ncbi:ATP-binding protein [Streptomyces sp. NBC_01264]|uniref:ATP-binding protein n=1 Tax=Streptomyces sp. NBC_01264 TaxID=2903804 RepID=UPI0022573597|nr:ATP-binding protein [Streptomyces sp. NBC_01264]MCX4784630.1 ATP-binding protein [Streptomyces sp. NBC_01264]
MKVLERITGLLGVGGERAAPPPRYEGIADGLVLTDMEAWAWYTTETSNSDLMGEAEHDAEQARAEAALTSTLAGMDVHLRILWSPYSADDYRAEAPDLYSAGRWEDWAEDRAARLDQIALPVRHVLLGVRLGGRTASPGRRITDAAGVSSRGVPARELATWHTAARRLGRRLEASPWRCAPAPVELLAWMVTREQHRSVPAPVAGRSLVSGALLAALTQGRVLPYPDHLRMVDAEGATAAWVSVLVMTAFPERAATPGPGEWLRALAEVSYLPPDDDGLEDDDVAARLVAVSPEASVRLRVLHKRAAIARTDQTARMVREQTNSAGTHAVGDPGRVITDAGEAMADLRAELEREELSLVEDHPRVVVTSTRGLEDLRARVDAVIAHYADSGITVQVGTDEQRPLWLETLAGDRVRVPDLGHVRDTRALAGAWWWGGARVGDDTGPIVGYLTGSTPGVVRLTPAANRKDATTTAYIGRSGGGKSTALAMAALEAGMAGAWALTLDFKGDLAGLVRAAERYGLPSRLVRMNRAMAGAADLIPLLSEAGRDAARAEVPAQLSLVTPAHLRAAGAETALQAATNAILDGAEPATWRVIEHLRASDDRVARETGHALWELAQTPQGALFMGRPQDGPPLLTTAPGVWVVQMPGLSLPTVGEDRERWTSVQALSVAVMHSVLAFGIITSGRPDLRTLTKLVSVPEVHVLTGTPQGRHFLDYVARVGRALGTHLHLDTQDATGLAALPGVVEQLAMVIGFRLTSAAQQDALAELLGLPPGPHARELIRSIGIEADGSVRHGHCVTRDRRFGAATMQWDIPTAELLDLLDTSPRADAETGDAPVADGVFA